MKVVDVKPYVVATPPPHHGGRYWVFVKLTTDTGMTALARHTRCRFILLPSPR